MFNIFAATLHIAGRSSIHNLRTRHAVVTGTHLSSTHPLLILHLLQHRCQNFDWEERARSLKFSPSLVGIPAGVRTGYLQKHFRYTKQVEGILGLLLVCWLCVWALDRWRDAPVFVCSSEFPHRGVVCATFGSRMKLCYNASTNLNPTSRPRVLKKISRARKIQLNEILL